MSIFTMMMQTRSRAQHDHHPIHGCFRLDLILGKFGSKKADVYESKISLASRIVKIERQVDEIENKLDLLIELNRPSRAPPPPSSSRHHVMQDSRSAPPAPSPHSASHAHESRASTLSGASHAQLARAQFAGLRATTTAVDKYAIDRKLSDGAQTSAAPYGRKPSLPNLMLERSLFRNKSDAEFWRRGPRHSVGACFDSADKQPVSILKKPSISSETGDDASVSDMPPPPQSPNDAHLSARARRASFRMYSFGESKENDYNELTSPHDGDANVCSDCSCSGSEQKLPTSGDDSSVCAAVKETPNANCQETLAADHSCSTTSPPSTPPSSSAGQNALVSSSRASLDVESCYSSINSHEAHTRMHTPDTSLQQQQQTTTIQDNCCLHVSDVSDLKDKLLPVSRCNSVPTSSTSNVAVRRQQQRPPWCNSLESVRDDSSVPDDVTELTPLSSSHGVTLGD